jgi:hypothetical protein
LLPARSLLLLFLLLLLLPARSLLFLLLQLPARSFLLSLLFLPILRRLEDRHKLLQLGQLLLTPSP